METPWIYIFVKWGSKLDVRLCPRSAMGIFLPKDTKQLKTNPQDLVFAIVKNNETRKGLIVSEVLKLIKGKKDAAMSVYPFTMKVGGNFPFLFHPGHHGGASVQRDQGHRL